MASLPAHGRRATDRTLHYPLRPSRTHYYISATYTAMAPALGATLIAGGPARFNTVTFDAARDLMPHWAWGLTILLAGIINAIGIATNSRAIRRVGLTAIAAWAFGFSACALWTCLHVPYAVWTPVYAYAWIGGTAIILARTDRGQIKS